MDAKYKDQFEMLNNSLWLLIKGYLEDIEPYKAAMSELFKLYIECDKAPKKFSDEWWNGSRKIIDCPDRYKGKQVCEFTAEMAIAFCNLFEYESKHGKVSSLEYYRILSEPFINEWERLRGVKK